MSRLVGNPHSAPENAKVVEEARNLVLRHFNTDSRHYDVVFTSGATASIKEWLETNLSQYYKSIGSWQANAVGLLH